MKPAVWMVFFCFALISITCSANEGDIGKLQVAPDPDSPNGLIVSYGWAGASSQKYEKIKLDQYFRNHYDSYSNSRKHDPILTEDVEARARVVAKEMGALVSSVAGCINAQRRDGGPKHDMVWCSEDSAGPLYRALNRLQSEDQKQTEEVFKLIPAFAESYDLGSGMVTLEHTLLEPVGIGLIQCRDTGFTGSPVCLISIPAPEGI